MSNVDRVVVRLPDQPATPEQRSAFARDGFLILPNVLDAPTVSALNLRLEHVLRGRYDRGVRPDKFPKLVKLGMAAEMDADRDREEGPNDGTAVASRNREAKVGSAAGPLGFSGNTQNVKVLQIINAQKSDSLFRSLATNAALGEMVSKIAGWRHGARLAQDQVWAKPPGAPPLTYHRDSPYFMFDPPDVVTVWVALDDMDEELGPLRYVRGSHLWGDGRVGSASTFFQSDGGMSLLRSAAEREGVSDVETNLEFISTAGLGAGGISIHDGRTWHGSGRNASKERPRRGVGLHYVPAEVRFTPDARKSSLWRQYVPEQVDDKSDNLGDAEISGEHCPVVWSPSNISSALTC